MVKRVKLTQAQLFKALSDKGTLSVKQFRCLGYKGPFTGWKKSMVGTLYWTDAIEKFISLKNAHLYAKRSRVSKKPNLKKEISVKITSGYYHPEWIKKRNKILERDRFRCVECGKMRADGIKLNVHHLLYIVGNELWDVPDWYLVTLCDKHHKKGHSMKHNPPSYKFDKDGNPIKK